MPHYLNLGLTKPIPDYLHEESRQVVHELLCESCPPVNRCKDCGTFTLTKYCNRCCIRCVHCGIVLRHCSSKSSHEKSCKNKGGFDGSQDHDNIQHKVERPLVFSIAMQNTSRDRKQENNQYSLCCRVCFLAC